MAEKSIKARVIQKHDTEENWLKATNFIPKQGELIIYDIDSTHDIERFKIGDGTTTVNNLPFRSIDGGYDALTEILPETTLNFTDSTSLPLTNCPPIEVGKKYIVTFDGTEYELVGKLGNTNFACIGNESFTWGSTDTGEPFLIFNSIGYTPSIWISSSETLPCTYNIKIKAATPIKINEKYLDIKNTNIVNGSKAGSLRTVGSSEESSEYTIGTCAFAEGDSTKASGDSSHAEGNNTTASGYASHAEGSSTNLFSSVVTATNPTNDDIITAWNSNKFSLAKGNSAHVEGIDSLALDDYSHAEGIWTTASGDSSHAEGMSTTASGTDSHAEGNHTIASGNNSHAEGSSTTASGTDSHAEGKYTKASGNNSHAEGKYTTASGDYSHTEGFYTTASGKSSHAEGQRTTASGYASHAEGNSTNLFSSVVTATNPTNNDIITAWNSKKFSLAKGISAHVEGVNSLALGDYSHAEGDDTTASDTSSHAEGFYTKASGTSSHAEGGNTTASNMYSHAEGNRTTASGINSHAEGNGTTASGNNSHAEGSDTTASSNYQHVQGKYNIVDTADTYADIIGNGSSKTNRSNAATVDWQGNAWYAGDVYVGSTSGTNRDEGSKKLATEEYVNSAISSSGGSGIVVDSELSSTSVNPVQNKVINTALGTKVDKVSGKGLSTNDYTSADKTKLSGIESGANKTVVDTALSDTSVNPVQNKVIKSYIDTQLVAITTDEIDSICV